MRFLSVLILVLFCSCLLCAQDVDKERSAGELLWYHSLFDFYIETSDPVLLPNANLIWVRYKGSGVPYSKIYCNTPTGDTVWVKEYDERFEITPTVVPELGWIIIGSTTGADKLYCIGQNGILKWKTSMLENLTQSPAFIKCCYHDL